MSGDHVRMEMLAAFRAAIDACDPAAAVRAALEAEDLPQRVRVLAIGKAAPSMVRGATAVLGDCLVDGVAACDHEEPVPDRIELVVGSHPRPDALSVEAGRRLLEAAANDDVDLLLVLVSGGGSAVAEVPRSPLTVDDIASVSDALMDDGAPIGELNTVRRHLSELKHGGILRRARVPVLSLLISDVAGAPASAIASGPTLQDASTPGDAIAILAKHEIDTTPDIRGVLVNEPRPISAVGHRWRQIVDDTTSAAAAASVLGDAPVLTTDLAGEAGVVATAWIARAPLGFSVLTGETTVHVSGHGSGGRNQHAALAAALAIEHGAVTFAALGTDGRDGPTDAAGAIVDGRTASAVRSAGIDPADSLRACDSYHALDAAGVLIRTGPTGTNVGDLWMIHRA